MGIPLRRKNVTSPLCSRPANFHPKPCRASCNGTLTIITASRIDSPGQKYKGQGKQDTPQVGLGCGKGVPLRLPALGSERFQSHAISSLLPGRAFSASRVASRLDRCQLATFKAPEPMIPEPSPLIPTDSVPE